MTYIAPALVEQGYIALTGKTPYQASSDAQVNVLRVQYGSALLGSNISKNTKATHLNINFAGTQNNREYVTTPGESQTNVANISGLMEDGGDRRNTIYKYGIGAQTQRSDALDENGNPALGSSPSNWESTTWKAGESGNLILERAYQDLNKRVAAILAENPNAEIALNLTGFSRGGAEAVAFANLLNERGIPGLYPPGQVPINSMVLFDPVSQTDGLLNVNWPTNLRNPALVLIAMAENRNLFPAMPIGADSIIVPIEAVHSDVGGRFNQGGISAVTLNIAHDYLNLIAANDEFWKQAA